MNYYKTFGCLLLFVLMCTGTQATGGLGGNFGTPQELSTQPLTQCHRHGVYQSNPSNPPFIEGVLENSSPPESGSQVYYTAFFDDGYHVSGTLLPGQRVDFEGKIYSLVVHEQMLTDPKSSITWSK